MHAREVRMTVLITFWKCQKVWNYNILKHISVLEHVEHFEKTLEMACEHVFACVKEIKYPAW